MEEDRGTSFPSFVVWRTEPWDCDASLASAACFCSNLKIYFPHFPQSLSQLPTILGAGQTGRRSLFCYGEGKALVVCVEHKYQVLLMTLTNGTGSSPPPHLPLHLSASNLLDLAMPLVHLCSDAGGPHASKNRAWAVQQVPDSSPGKR